MKHPVKITACLLFLTGYSLSLSAQSMTELTHFNLLSGALTDATGEELSRPAYQPSVYWFPVDVPSTVLTGLVQNGIYPDPYIGMNNMMIPDACDSFNTAYNLEQYSYLPNDPNPWKKPYWYRTTFRVPAEDQGRHFELIFKGINYRAAVWLNGEAIADSSEMAGMFAEFSFDVTSRVKAGSENALAVKIYPLDYPGLPSTEQLRALGDFYANGGPTGDIGKNVTMLCSAGWDWIPPVRDRNMGIWQPVFLRTTGPVTIEHPHLVTDLPRLPDTSVAALSLEIPLINRSKSDLQATVNIQIEPQTFEGKSIEVTRNITIGAGKKTTLRLNSSNTPGLKIKDPHLWWPAGNGRPDLYRTKITIENAGMVSDEHRFHFGIRTVSSKTTYVKEKKSLRRDFYVNGRKIILLGGAWVPDMMVNRDSARYDHELRMCRRANLNLIRIWGGGITPPDAFFEMADKYGLLVWSDFWITGDTNGEFKGSPDYPLQGNIFINNMTSTILRIRNHPSLLVWTGGNEGHARKELYYAMRDSVISLDGTRPFIPSSSGYAELPEDWKASWPDNQPSGVYSGGPYSWQEPAHYFELINTAKGWVFKDETGIPSQPPYNIMPKIIPDLVWDTTLPFPLNNTWGYHDAATGNGKFDRYYTDMVSRFGKPVSMKNYCDKMQFMNAMGYQGIFESALHNLNSTGGIMLWKLNASFPSVIWQIYDWYLVPNAGYYFIRNACKPVHVQFNRDDSAVAVINRTYHLKQGLKVRASLWTKEGSLLFSKNIAAGISPYSVREILSLKENLENLNGVALLFLELTDSSDDPLSRNVYWLSSDNDFNTLSSMETASVKTELITKSQRKNEKTFRLLFTNQGNKPALLVHPRLTQKDEEILPSFWSSNYFSLQPGESIKVSVSIPQKIVKSGPLMLETDGWNVEDQQMKVE